MSEAAVWTDTSVNIGSTNGPVSFFALALVGGASSTVSVTAISINGSAMTLEPDRPMQPDTGDQGRWRAARLDGASISGALTIQLTKDSATLGRATLVLCWSDQSTGVANIAFVPSVSGANFSAAVASNANSQACFAGVFYASTSVTPSAPTVIPQLGGTPAMSFLPGSTEVRLGALAEPGATSSLIQATLAHLYTPATVGWIGSFSGAGGAAAPVLSAPTVADTATTATGGFSTTGVDGTAYMVWTLNSSAPTAAQIKAGQNAAGGTAGVVAPASLPVSSAGAKTFAAVAVTSGLTYYGWAVHTSAGGLDSNVLALGAAYPNTGRPVADVSAGGFTPSTGASLAALLNKDSVNDSTFITSPVLSSTPATCAMTLSKSYAAGTYSGVKFRMWTSSGTAQARIRFLDSTGASVGVTASQTVTTTPTTYTLPVTLTGTATRVQIEQNT